MRALHLAVVLLLVGSTVGAAVPPAPSAADDAGDADGAAAVPAAVAQQTTPEPPTAAAVLGVSTNGSDRSAVNEAYVDLGPALRFGTERTSARLETLAAVERVRAADEGRRAAQIDRELSRVEGRVDTLRADQRRALGAYARNESTGRELLVRLARIDREARALAERTDRLSRLANRTGADVDRSRLVGLDRELALYTGPVRDLAADALAGEAPVRRVYVAATSDAVVLATLTEGTYLREAYRGDLRRLGGGTLSPRDTLEAVEREYPRIWADRERASFDGGRIGVGRVRYGNGTLDVAVGSGNGRVFADEHRQTLTPTAAAVGTSNTRDGLRLVVNRTYAGGPMRIELRDGAGAPVDASVTVGPAGGESVTVGRTGGDGTLWALTPGERYTVVAIRGQSVVFVTTDPLATPRTGGDGPAA